MWPVQNSVRAERDDDPVARAPCPPGCVPVLVVGGRRTFVVVVSGDGRTAEVGGHVRGQRLVRALPAARQDLPETVSG